MVTSRSNNGGWRASALLFSGRANPEWPVSDSDAARLTSIWSTLARVPASTLASRLGYFGCVLSNPTRRWHAFGGIAMMSSASDTETRNDSRRDFERAILATAPAGTIPDAIAF
jgi:hypothetical protein